MALRYRSFFISAPPDRRCNGNPSMNLPTIYDLAVLPMLFAQEAEDVGGGGEEAAEGGNSIFGSLWFPMLIICVVWLFVMMIPRGDQKKHREMLDNLKKNDRVLTAGGIYGTVVTSRKDDPFVTLRVDESTNTRLKVLKTSISRVITGDDKPDKDAGDADGSSDLKSV